MKYLATISLACWLMCNVASADVILTAVVNGPSTVTAGTNITLDIFVRSSITGGQVIDGIDVNVNAATTNNGAGTGAAGTFTSGTTFLLGATNFDVLGNGPGQAFSTNFQIGGIPIPDTNTLYGRLTLNTTGVTAGDYFFVLDQLAANSPTLGPITISGTVAGYSVVPEPSSLAVMGLTSFGLIAWRRRRGQAARKSRQA